MKDVPPRQPFGGRSEADYLRLLEAKVSPESLRVTLAIASIFQITHEMLKVAIVDKVHGFHCHAFVDGVPQLDMPAYERSVLMPSRTEGGNANAFRGSVLWLVQGGAITDVEANRLEAIYLHRHQLTHELAKYLIDVDHNPDVALLLDAITILTKAHRFWIKIELESGGLWIPEYDDWVDDVAVEDVTPLGLMLLRMCVDAVSAPVGPA